VDEQDRYSRQDENDREVAREDRLLAAAVDRDDHDERQYGELRRLQLERAEREPSLRAERGVTEMGEHRDQRQNDEAVEQVGPLLEPVIVDKGHHDHDDEAHDQPKQLAL